MSSEDTYINNTKRLINEINILCKKEHLVLQFINGFKNVVRKEDSKVLISRMKANSLVTYLLGYKDCLKEKI